MMQKDSYSPYEKTRRFKRKKFESRVGILSKGSFLFGTGLEVGEGGMLLRTELPLAVRDSVEIQFLLPNGAFVSARAEVVYSLQPASGDHCAGLRFLDPSEDIRKHIRAFVENP